MEEVGHLLGRGLLTWLIPMVGSVFIARMDPEWRYRPIHCHKLVLYGAAVIMNATIPPREGMVSRILTCLLLGLLLLACLTDLVGCFVYRFVWWFAWTCGILLLLQTDSFRPGSMMTLGSFILLQEVWFAGMYGRADCHAFVACALLEVALGAGMLELLLHMAVTFGLLALVQGLRGNIAKNGTLIVPQPLLPYIAIGLCVIRVCLL